MCEFEERPGPAPLDVQEEDCTTIYIVYRGGVEIRHGGGADVTSSISLEVDLPAPKSPKRPRWRGGLSIGGFADSKIDSRLR